MHKSRVNKFEKEFSKEVLDKIQIKEYNSIGEVDIKGRQKPIEIFKII